MTVLVGRSGGPGQARAVLLESNGRNHRAGGVADGAGRPAGTTSGSPRCRLGVTGDGSGSPWSRSGRSAAGSCARTPISTWSSSTTAALGVDTPAEQLWYHAVGCRHRVDHVRTPGQAVQVAATDPRAAFGLLEVRHIAGDPAAVGDGPRHTVRQAPRAGIRNRFDEINEKAPPSGGGATATSRAPDRTGPLNGHGGLRDIQLIDALATAQLLDRPSGRSRRPERAARRPPSCTRRSGRAWTCLRAQDAGRDRGDRRVPGRR
ncbi:hypothetical protein HBB16_08815 [Pseudonocardia sp. MCCB 268]|nr:hypothetical protein [Pseudonocardia cytotoxica]